MILCLLRISDADIAQLIGASVGAGAFINMAEAAQASREGYTEALKQMEAMGLRQAPEVDMTFDAYPFDDIFDVDKMWHGLYFLLTGTECGGDAPANYLLSTPNVRGEGVGHVSARAISTVRTKELSDYLGDLDRLALLTRFDGVQMTALDIYPGIWDEDPEELKEGLGHAFDALKAYCRKCADHGLGMLSFIA